MNGRNTRTPRESGTNPRALGTNPRAKKKLGVNFDSVPERLKLLGFETYRQYLASPHWTATKAQFRAQVPEYCAGCKKSGVRLAVHHKTYKRLGRERMTDLVFLCEGDQGCHKEFHSRRWKWKGRGLWAMTGIFIRSFENAKIEHAPKPPTGKITPTVSRTIGNTDGIDLPWHD